MDTVNRKLSAHPEWTVPSGLYGTWAVLKNGAPFVALLCAAPLLSRWSAVAPWLLAPLVGLFAYRLTIVMHDCAHGTLFKKPRTNAIVGRLLGAATGIDFHQFARLHRKHHRIYGCHGDPQGFHYLGHRSRTRAGFIFHLLKPLLGLNLPRVFRESHLYPRNLQRSFAGGDLMTVVTVQIVILLIVTGAGQSLWLAALPFASTVTFGLFFSQLRGIAEHGVTGRAIEEFNVRSHAPHWLDRILLYDLNFNYHKEHHLYPQCPSRHLPAIHETLFAGDPQMHESMFRTIGSLLTDRAPPMRYQAEI